jgi:hypothetical protein
VKKHITAIMPDPDLLPPIPERESIRYGEYKSISNEALFNYFLESQKSRPQRPDGYTIAALSNNSIVGWLTCDIDSFDGENFLFPCMQISAPLIYTDHKESIELIVRVMLAELERVLKEDHPIVHVRCAIPNAPLQNNIILSAMIAGGFFYLQTLLTYLLPEGRQVTEPPSEADGVVIRNATDDDADQVATIAANSFKFSRYHLDPFLDNENADKLLYKSTQNAIRHHFADVVFVAEVNAEIVGYFSGKKRKEALLSKRVGETGFTAVKAKSRGHGVLGKLTDHLLYWFSNNTDFAELGTYLGNTTVHRTWISRNLPIIKSTHQISRLIKR